MRLLCSGLLVLAALSTAEAQTPQRTTLNLEEALTIAERNNPQFLQAISGRSRAQAAMRTAWGALLPGASASAGVNIREGRQEYFAGQLVGSNVDRLTPSWSINANQRLSWGTFANIRRAGAQLDAAEADLEAARFALRSGVSAQYLLALQTEARAALQDTLVVQQRLQLELAQARAGVGAGTTLDVKRAEVGLGTQEVAALRARNAAEVERLRLFQQLGVPMPDALTLDGNLPMTAPTFQLEDLLATARRENPALLAVQARQRVAVAGVNSARGEYTPTLSFNASIGGSGSAPIDSTFPTLARNPYNLNLGVSIPIFDGLGREQRLQDANANRSDAAYNLRRQELTLTADVTSAFVTVRAAHRAAELQARNAATAREALQLAEERYRVGANTFVDLTTARAEYERAETDRIDAVYEFHRAFAALENAVGRTLR